MEQHKARMLPVLSINAGAFSMYLALLSGGNFVGSIAIAIVGLAVFILLLCLYVIYPRQRPNLMLVAWFCMWTQLFGACLYRRGDAFNEFLGWAIFYQFFTLYTVPWNRRQLIFLGLLSKITYLGIQYFNALAMNNRLPTDFLYQILTDAALLSVASIIGASSFLTLNENLKLFFAQIRYTLFVKKAMEKQAVEQERLVLSVLPEHVALQMRDNLGLIDTQFKKIYMSRHENVSILYADIVGFTAISSTYSAQDLVAILNELFARFDRLAEANADNTRVVLFVVEEFLNQVSGSMITTMPAGSYFKYEQLRIKILGDCYYCISGAPVEREDHAVLCVHMGLSMVKAIKYVQQTANSPVDMRVGIHTGAVLAGVLGQRQWQFDVYSRDVELANKMESSGMAGRVHISEVTLSYLKDEFEVEPAFGERREEMLRQAGIKTYFITKVLKPLEEHGDTDGADDGEIADTISAKEEEEEEVKSKMQLIVPSQLNGTSTASLKELNGPMDFTDEELLALDSENDPNIFSSWWLFKDKEIEKSYLKSFELCPIIASRLPIMLLPAFGLLSTFIVPVPWTHLLFIVSCLISIIYNWQWRYCNESKLNNPLLWRTLVLQISIALLILDNSATLVMCALFENTHNNINNYTTKWTIYNSLSETLPHHDEPARCYHPSYYYHVGAVALCATIWLRSRMRVRGIIIALIVFSHSFPAVLMPVHFRPGLDYDPYSLDNCSNNTSMITMNREMICRSSVTRILIWLHGYRDVLMLVFIAAAIFKNIINFEWEERLRFYCGRRLQCDNQRYQEMSKRNQAMVNNVLPPHVAKHFMGSQHQHRDLYSQSYSEVGVLFASMPNFTEFYSEESVNNQGLECLRFLNEVISDFDMLLDDPRFSKYICKIKTISSTYMAASGLGPKDKLKVSNAAVVRWEHLSWLVVFALELQRTLAAINEQSFNHFVLRLGINHGPITAGVIGARKPHYDIWGNTVNVASRMESTGKAGCIQVTSETAKILLEFGYKFEQRGLVAVKGKGELMTYYLLDKDLPSPPPIEPGDPETYPRPEPSRTSGSGNPEPCRRQPPSAPGHDLNMPIPEIVGILKKEKKNVKIQMPV